MISPNFGCHRWLWYILRGWRMTVFEIRVKDRVKVSCWWLDVGRFTGTVSTLETCCTSEQWGLEGKESWKEESLWREWTPKDPCLCPQALLLMLSGNAGCSSAWLRWTSITTSARDPSGLILDMEEHTPVHVVQPSVLLHSSTTTTQTYVSTWVVQRPEDPLADSYGSYLCR